MIEPAIDWMYENVFGLLFVFVTMLTAVLARIIVMLDRRGGPDDD